jgi:predicted P-loop ATPase
MNSEHNSSANLTSDPPGPPKPAHRQLGAFPDQPPAGSSNRIPATIDNVAHLLQHAGIDVRYNVIKKKDEVKIPSHHGTSDNLDNVALTTIMSIAAKYGLPTGLVPDFVQALADRNAYNPVADWILGRPWDGIDRLCEICATVVEQGDYPEPLKQILIRKWLLSATAAALVPSGFKCRGVLTLQGPQGIGKTSWVKALITDPRLRDDVVKLDHHLDVANKDTILGAITHWIVEIGELESSFRKDIARLKGFLTTDFDRVRRPYGRRESEYPRRTVFLATVNDANFLTDTTGNTRWWTIAVQSLDFKHVIDMQQVFAQSAADLKKGAEWWLGEDEEAALEAWNRRHRVVSAIAEKLVDYIDLDRRDGKTSAALTATEMLEVMGFERPTNPQCKECAAALRELLGESKRIKGRDKWRVPLREGTADSLKPIARRQTAEDEDEF